MKRIQFLLFFIIIYIHGFKIDRVILATDANPDYIEFWPIVAKAWKKIGVQPTLALIADKNVCIDESLGDVIRFEPIIDVPTSFHAQTIRLLLPILFENENCLISDIDMIPLKGSYFQQSIESYNNDAFVIYRNKAYNENECKYPMCYVAASGSTFRDVFCIKDKCHIPEKIKQWFQLGLGWSTDELLLYQYLNQWPQFNEKCIFLGHCVEKRIDRSLWEYDPILLQNEYYIDMHCPRPYSQNKDIIDFVYDNNQKKIVKKRSLGDADYGTHMPALVTTVAFTKGPVLEMGCGDFSTPLLHALCAKDQRFLLTVDTDKKWLGYFLDLYSHWHQLWYLPVYEDDWMKNPKPYLWDQIGNNVHWSVVFIDHRPGERRVIDIQRLRNNTDIFVVHDTQEASYDYEPTLSSFKYKYVYERYTTQTTIVSDTIDITTFFKD